MARDFKIELDNVEMINGSDDLLKDTKVTKVTLTGENKLNSLNSTFENCTELTAIEGDVNLDGVSDMTEMTLNTPLDEIKVTNPTEENIQTDNSLNQVTNVKIGGTKYAKGGIQDVVGSLEWTAENFTYKDAILDNVYTNSASVEESKNITVSNTLEQKATSIEITGQTYENLVNGKATKNLLDEMSMQQTEGKPTQFTPHMEQPICLEYIEGQTYQNLVDGKGEETLISEYSSIINDFVPNTFKPPQNQLICLESMEGETYQNLVEGKGEYKLTDTFSTTWTESNNSIENPPNMIEIPEIWGNTVQGYVNHLTAQNFVDMVKNTQYGNPSVTGEREVKFNSNAGGYYAEGIKISMNNDPEIFCGYTLKANTTYTFVTYPHGSFNIATPSSYYQEYNSPVKPYRSFTTDDTGRVIIRPVKPFTTQGITMKMLLIEGEVHCDNVDFDLNYIQSVGDLYVDESGEPILDEEGNEQYKLEIESKNVIFHDEYKNLPVGKFYLKKGDYTFSWNISFGLVLARTRIYNLQGQFIGSLFESDNRRGSGRLTLEGTKNITINEDGWYMETLGAEDSIGYITQQEGHNADTSIIPQSNKTTILMPQQLMSIGDVLDKLYWDNSKKIYNIKYNDIRITNDLSAEFVAWGNINVKNVVERDNFVSFSLCNMNIPRLTLGAGTYVKCNAFKCTPSHSFDYTTKSLALHWSPSYGVGLSLMFNIPKEELNTYDIEGVKEWVIKNKDLKIIYLAGLDLEAETKILEKPSLDAYSPKTYISTNTEIQPSQMTVTNKEVKFIPLSLQPSKSYTIQLDSVGKDDKPITVNLGGATTTIQPTNDTSKHHRVSITTPSELTTDNLGLSGEGVIVNDVMLFEGNTSVIKQDVDYMDGIQSIGELFESRNLFDYTQSEVGLLDHTNGKISKDNSWKYTTDFIPVEPNTTYCISQTSGSVFNYKIVEYNSSKTYLKGTNWTSSKGTDINRAYNTFTTSANTYYLRLGWQVSIFEIQLEEDTFPTEFMAYDTVRYKLEIQTYDSTWDSI